MQNKELREIAFILIILSIVYIILKHFVIYWNYLVYPITILVTFMHEFGHSFFAFITWWWVKSIQVNPDWSWLATTYWWFRPLVLMWWYIWSAIFGNLLLYIWATKKNTSRYVILFLSILIIFISIFSLSFNLSQIISSILLIILAFILAFFWFKIKEDHFNRIFLMFLWIASILYIIEDFNIWPSSDIKKFTDYFIIIPEFLWMFIWLFIVLFITFYTLKIIFKKKKTNENDFLI